MFVAEILRGPLDTGALGRALTEITARHEVLRSRCPSRDGAPVQVVGDGPELELLDLTGLPEDGRVAEACRLGRERIERRFDLEHEPPVRMTLMRLSEREHALCAVFHHIAVDGWSVGVFLKELAALYGAFLAGEPSPLPPLPIQYADFARWQRERLDGLAEEHLGHWRKALADPPTLELPTDRPRPPVRTANGGYVTLSLPAPVSDAVDRLARQARCTPFITMLTAYLVLLSRYSGQRDICVGTPVASRGRPELEPLIGLFLNTLVIRGDLSGDPTFQEMLRRVRSAALSAYSRDEFPFDRLVGELNLPRDLSRTPLFQAQIVQHDYAGIRSALPGITVEPLDVVIRPAAFDLSLEFGRRNGRLDLDLVYNSDLFDRSTAERMLGHLATMLARAAEDPARRLSEIARLDEAERERLLTAWNDTAAPRPETTLHDLVTGEPGAIAASCEGRSVTYAELETAANRLANRLRREGYGPASSSPCARAARWRR
nr:hypothetical protein GCM10020093_049810 [Planobispora longispora]